VGFLWVATLRNRVRRQLQRLKQPKYLAGALVGVGYVYLMLVRRFDPRGTGQVSEGGPVLLQALMVGSSLMTVLSAWAFGPDRPAVTFSEGEIQHFLPAPVTRRALLHYKLLRGFAGGALGVLFAALFMFRAMSNPLPLFLLGGLVVFAVVYLHATAASFVRTRLAEHGWRGTAVRFLLLGSVLAGVAWVVFLAWQKHPFPEMANGWRDLRRWLTALLAEPSLVTLSWPLRVLVDLPLSPDVGTFLRRLPGPLVLLALHYVWVMAIRVPFEETAVLRGEARARERASRMDGSQGLERLGRIQVRGTPFGALSPVGRPEVALFWKNMVGGWRLGGPHSLLGIILVGALVQAILGFVSPHYASIMRMTLAPTCAMFALILCLVGPSMFRNDLRMDLRKLDLLRALPLRGREIVAAELLAPALMLALIQVVLVASTVALGMGMPLKMKGSQWGSEAWLAGGLAAAIVLPAVSLGGLFVQNAAVVLFPAWLPPEGERVRGLDVLGQRLLALAGTVLVLLVGLLPSGLAAAIVGFGLHYALGLGVWALPFAGLAAAVVLVVVVGFGVLALGRAFDRLDISGEGPGIGV
jgi:hypothetical protein